MGNVNSGYNFWTKIPASYVLHGGCQAEGCGPTMWWGGPYFGDMTDVHLVRAGRKGCGKGLFASSLQAFIWPTAAKMLGTATSNIWSPACSFLLVTKIRVLLHFLYHRLQGQTLGSFM